MSAIQGGAGFPFFSEAVFHYLATGCCTDANIDSACVPDYQLREFIKEMDTSSGDAELRSSFALNEEMSTLLFETGYSKPVTMLSIADIPEIRSTLVDYCCILKVKAAMDQFKEGLDIAGLGRYLREKPELIKPLFVNSQKALTADDLKGLLKVKFADRGSLIQPSQEATYIYFVDFLEECKSMSALAH